jgi:NADH-quinone oxidoreductase subunit L
MMLWSVQIAIILICLLPIASFVIQAVPAWLGYKLTERKISRIVAITSAGVFICSATSSIGFHYLGAEPITVYIGEWFKFDHYSFKIQFVGDKLSLAFVAFASILVGLIGLFSERYLHREPGYSRFYLLLSLFALGVNLLAMAKSLDLFLVGWELVGITSVLLISFFDYRRNPLEHGLKAFMIYRICDIGLLVAVIALHHVAGTTDFHYQVGHYWYVMSDVKDSGAGYLIGFSLLLASMGKAAQVPFSGWLPKAMEGPTPSSAIFYGAISVHLGAFLLLRSADLIAQLPLVGYSVILVGLVTAIHATMVGRVQTDIKSSLAYASMTQVGIIFVEIGLGFYWIPLFHIVGHALIRSLQILKSPNILHDYQHLEQVIGHRLPETGVHLAHTVPTTVQKWLYRHSLERSYLDAFLSEYIVYYWNKFIKRLDQAEKVWIKVLAGKNNISDERILK